MGCGDEDHAIEEAPSSSGSGCQSANGCSAGGCQGQQQHQQPQGSFGSWARRQHTAAADSASPAAADGVDLGPCRKCKQRPAVLHIRQHEPYCYECLEAGIQQKVRTATKTRGLVQTGDHVMLAISGGAASLALLSCIMEMKSTSPARPERGKVPFVLTVVHIGGAAVSGRPNWESVDGVQQLQDSVAAAGYQGQLLVLPLSAVFEVDHRSQQQSQPAAAQRLLQQMQQLHITGATAGQQQRQVSDSAVAEAAPAAVAVADSGAGACAEQQHEQKLQELLSSIRDSTGREDLLLHLQEQLLLSAAVALGCNRLLFGECASRVAAKIISDAAKGRGYSLPADIQLLDARHQSSGGPVVIHPLREVTYKELVALCRYKGISWSDRPVGTSLLQRNMQVAANGGSRAIKKAEAGAVTVNSLAEKFIDDMQQSVPGSIYTILRTAAHLQPFGFNDILAVPEAISASLPPTARAERAKLLALQQQQQQEGGAGESVAATSSQLQLCSVCQAPLPELPAADLYTAERAAGEAAMAAEARLHSAGLTGSHSRQLCYSCNRQILLQMEAATATAVTGCDGLDAKMQRLKQLLPAGMVLED